MIPLMPSASHQSPGLAAVAVSLTTLTHGPAPGLAASSRLHCRVVSMLTGPASLAPALAHGALGPVRPRRCYMLLSALPPTAQPGHCHPPVWPLPTVLTALTTTSTPTLSLSPSLSPSPSLSLSHTHTLSLSLPRRLSLSIYISLSLYLSLALSMPLATARSLTLSRSLSRALSLTHIHIYI